MKIGFDATSLCRNVTGIENYALSLCKNLLQYDIKNQYVIFFRKEVHDDFLSTNSRSKNIVCPLDNQIICEQIWLPYIISKEKLNIVHFPAFPPGLFVPGIYVITLHDATMWKYPQTLSWKNRAYMKPLTNAALKKALKIITVSESSKRDIIECCNVNENKIVNTRESINATFGVVKDKATVERVKSKLRLPDKFILSVGSIEPRKNLTTLLRAYKLLKQKRGNLDYMLVLVGRRAWGNKEIWGKIVELGIEKDVLFTGHIDENDLKCVYNLARLFVFPSIYEGFGLPPLEAMACGVPVLASDTASLQEVLGDAAVLIPPLNVEAMSINIELMMQDDSLRKKLREKGAKQIKSYSWEEVAKKTIQTYESIS